jgi:hypothetical protein
MVVLCSASLSLTAYSAEKKKVKTKKAADKTTEEKAENSSKSGGEKSKASAKSYKKVPYGMAGCGLWSTVIKDKEKGPQIAVSLLNDFLFGLQTFAISSGTLNCVEGKSEVAVAEKKVYISSNLNSLSKEAAQGTGVHILALAEVYGCPGDEFAQFSQENFAKLYQNDNPEAVLASYEEEIRAKPNLHKSCKRAG